jgi:hypothetical protein
VQDTISLPCDFKVDHRVEKETRVVWLKDGVELAINNRNSRYEIQPNKSLVVKNIELGDAGQYACKVYRKNNGMLLPQELAVAKTQQILGNLRESSWRARYYCSSVVDTNPNPKVWAGFESKKRSDLDSGPDTVTK